ncbi:hypothetical protein AB0D09_02765 [Streptomyces sp. NPDC049097]
MLCAFFAACALGALAGLLLIVPRDVPAISATCALILTIAALAVAVVH